MIHVHAGVREEKFEAAVPPIVRCGVKWGVSCAHADLVHVHAGVGKEKFDTAVPPNVRCGLQWGASIAYTSCEGNLRR